MKETKQEILSVVYVQRVSNVGDEANERTRKVKSDSFFFLRVELYLQSTARYEIPHRSEISIERRCFI